MERLYPLKFSEIFKPKVWGGTRLSHMLNKDCSTLANCGESWELAAVDKDVSVVRNGFLQGNDLRELAEVYMGDLVGDHVFERFGVNFPLLFKFLDTSDYLSVQVHPDDVVAAKKQQGMGKTEMWYVLQADPGAELIVGFREDIDRETFLYHLENKSLRDILNVEKPRPGDVYLLPPGRVHAIGAGFTICEIQQASDVTYRVYDWDRPGMDGKPRQLHVKEALDVMDFKAQQSYKTSYQLQENGSVNLVKSRHFTTNLLNFEQPLEMDYFFLDSFVVYVCLDGKFTLKYPWGSETIQKGETVLLPAEIKNVQMVPDSKSRVLETYIH
jgi:mannose-6-phosphate isomerase